jgi:hypothetical protein
VYPEVSQASAHGLEGAERAREDTIAFGPPLRAQRAS